MSPSSRDIRYDLARDRARGLLTLTRQRPPVDVKAFVELAGVPIVERVLVDGVRGTIGDIAGQQSIILNRHHRFHSEQERQWVLAEELGHVLLGHQLVESTAPGKSTIGLLEERRILYEREARAFAAELLMPFFEVRKRWFAVSQERPVEGELSLEDRVTRLAEEFSGRDARAAPADEIHPSVKEIADRRCPHYMDNPQRIGAAVSSDVIRLAVAYNDALDRCTQTGGANIDEVMAFFADDAVRIVVGPGENSLAATQAGKPAIRDGFLRRAERLQQVVELKGIEICGDWVVCRRERRDTTYP